MSNVITVTIAGQLRTIQLTEAATAYLLEYGAKQALADSIAGIKGKLADFNEGRSAAGEPDMTEADFATTLIEKRIRAIETGTVRTREGGDALQAEVKRLLAKAMGKAWTGLTGAERTAKAQALIAGGGNEKAKAILDEAKANVAEAASLADGADLGL